MTGKDGINISIPAWLVASFVNAIQNSKFWLIVAAALWGGTDAWSKIHNTNINTRTGEAVDRTEVAVEATKTIVEEEATPAVKDVAHKLENGLADRIATKVILQIENRLTPMSKRLEAIEWFLLSDEAAEFDSNPNPTINALVLPVTPGIKAHH